MTTTSPTTGTCVATTLTTPDGPFTMLTAEDGAVLAAGWTDAIEAVAGRNGAIDRWVRDGGGDSVAVAAVQAFYDGDPEPAGRVPTRQPGTEFLHQVWLALRDIPAGTRMTYGSLATALGRPGAARAVGRACGLNAPALFVPCHRVVGGSGSLTGFAWGVDVKRALLAREAMGSSGDTLVG